MYRPRPAVSRPATPAPRRLRELLLLDHVSAAAAIAAVTASLLTATVLAALLVVAQQHFLSELSAGDHLNPWSALLASGSTAATAWIGWAATICFSLAVLMLKRSQPEPAAGLGPAESLSVTELRRGLRTEYRHVRIALVLLTVLSIMDCIRTAITIAIVTRSGASTAPGQMVAMPVEALGLVVAAALLAIWAREFRRELEQWGTI